MLVTRGLQAFLYSVCKERQLKKKRPRNHSIYADCEVFMPQKHSIFSKGFKDVSSFAFSGKRDYNKKEN